MSAIRIERIDAGHAKISGRLGFPEAAAALARGSELRSQAQEAELAVDVAGLEGIDSATLAVLLAWGARAARAGTTLRFVNAPRDLAALARACDAEPLLGLSSRLTPPSAKPA